VSIAIPAKAAVHVAQRISRQLSRCSHGRDFVLLAKNDCARRCLHSTCAAMTAKSIDGFRKNQATRVEGGPILTGLFRITK